MGELALARAQLNALWTPPRQPPSVWSILSCISTPEDDFYFINTASTAQRAAGTAQEDVARPGYCQQGRPAYQ